MKINTKVILPNSSASRESSLKSRIKPSALAQQLENMWIGNLLFAQHLFQVRISSFFTCQYSQNCCLCKTIHYRCTTNGRGCCRDHFAPGSHFAPTNVNVHCYTVEITSCFETCSPGMCGGHVIIHPPKIKFSLTLDCPFLKTGLSVCN